MTNTLQAPTFFDQYNDFADACGNPRGTITVRPDAAFLAMCSALIDEELNKEFLPALEKYRLDATLENFVPVVDGIVDTVYVLMQMARTLGVPFNEAWKEVHNSNMAKVVNGKVIRREDGKILKPEGWQPPNLWELCYKQYVANMKAVQFHKAGEILGDA